VISASGAEVEMNRVSAGSLVLEPQIAAHATEMFDVLSDPAIYERDPTRQRLNPANL
jgi:hypothetical protein